MTNDYNHIQIMTDKDNLYNFLHFDDKIIRLDNKGKEYEFCFRITESNAIVCYPCGTRSKDCVYVKSITRLFDKTYYIKSWDYDYKDSIIYDFKKKSIIQRNIVSCLIDSYDHVVVYSNYDREQGEPRYEIVFFIPKEDGIEEIRYGYQTKVRMTWFETGRSIIVMQKGDRDVTMEVFNIENGKKIFQYKNEDYFKEFPDSNNYIDEYTERRPSLL